MATIGAGGIPQISTVGFSPALQTLWDASTEMDIGIVLDGTQKEALGDAAEWGIDNPFHASMVGSQPAGIRWLSRRDDSAMSLTGNIVIESFMLVFAWSHLTEKHHEQTPRLLAGLLIGAGHQAIMQHARSLSGYPWFESSLMQTLQVAYRVADQLLSSAKIYLNDQVVSLVSLSSSLSNAAGPSNLRFVFDDHYTVNVGSKKSIWDFTDIELADAMRARGLNLSQTARDLNVSKSALSMRIKNAPAGSPLYDIKRDPRLRPGRKPRVPK